MAYNKKTWKARQGLGLNKFSIDGATPVPVINQPDSVTQQGDALSAGNLNDLEQRIADAFYDVEESKADKSTTDALQSQINQHESRLENLEQKAGDYTTVQYRGTNAVPTGKAKYGLVKNFVGKSRAWNQLITRTTGVSYSDTPVGWTNIGEIPAIFDVSHSTLLVIHVSSVSSNASLRLRYPYIYTLSIGWNYILAPPTLNNTGFMYQIISSDGNAVSCSIDVEFARDLTLIFPEGVPSTIAECVQKCPDLLKYDAYNISLVDETLSGAKSKGVNMWDEEWELGGYSKTDGTKTTASVTIRAKNSIRCLPSTTYFLRSSSVSSVAFCLFFYDANGDFISYLDDKNNTSFTTPSNAVYMTFQGWSVYGTTYNHDIQICLNSYADKTTYHPYKTDTISLSETVTLRSAGSVADELDVESGVVTRYTRKVVDLSELTWSNVNNDGRFISEDVGAKVISENTMPNIVSSKYLPDTFVHLYYKTNDKRIGTSGSKIYVYDSSYTSLGTVEPPTGFLGSLVGQSVVVELATPTTESIDPIIDNFIEVEGGGTVETIQTQSPVIDNCLDVGYLTV